MYYKQNLFDEIIVDNFAGGGGASTGIELALGRPVDIAVNHDENAILMHKKNHPVKGSDIDNPLDTITSIDHNALCSVVMSAYYGNGDNASPIDEPVKTITAVERHAVVKVCYRKLENTNIGYWPQIREMLNNYANYNLADDEIIVLEINGIDYILVDIEMRMLVPKELYAAQGFPKDYNFTLDGKMTKTEQVKKVGNSVCPQIARALVDANMNEESPQMYNSMEELLRAMTI